MLQQLVNGLSIGAVYAVFAMGFTLVFGVLNILNLSQGAVFMWGAYVGLEMVRSLDVPLPVAILVAMAAAGLLGVASELLVFRLLRRRNAHRWMGMVASLALARIMIAVAQEVFGTQVVTYPHNALANAAVEVFGARVQVLQLVATAVALVMMASVTLCVCLISARRALSLWP